MHTNYPYGEILHFTRITDVFWLFFSAPLFLFMPVKEAVFYGGCVYQTGVLILSAMALIWALKPVVPAFVRLIGLCIFFVQPSVTETYILIKPDHHVLTALFGCLTAGGLIHYLAKQQLKYVVVAGIAAGLGLWVSVEGLLIAYTLLAGLAALCLLNKEKIKSCAVYFFSFFVTSFLCLIVNPPYEGFFYPDNGRLSFLLVTVIGMTTTALLLLFWAEEKNQLRTFWRKSAGFAVTAAFFIGLLFLIFPPSVVFQPFFPPIIKEIWAKNVIELQPCFRNLTVFFLGGWPSLLSLLIVLIIFKFCTPIQRSFLILTVIPLIVFTGFSFASVRYSRLATLFIPFPLTIMFSLRKNSAFISERQKGIALFILFISALVYLCANYISVNKALSQKSRPSLDIIKPYVPEGEGSILADTFLGPEIIWTLDEPVIGTPYHRNIEGIADGVGMLHSRNISDAVAVLKKHRVKAILLHLDVPAYPEIFYNTPLRSAFLYMPAEMDSLFARMVREKDLPCGIEPEINVAPPFIMYTVDFSKCSGKKDLPE